MAALEPSQREYLAHASRASFVQRGETIWTEGCSLRHFAVVASGFVKMVRSSANGQEVAAELIGPGQVMGLVALIRETPSPLTARSVSDTWLVRVPKTEFMEIYSKSLGLRDAVLELASSRLTQAHDMMARMSSARVEDRIAAVLLVLAQSYGIQSAEGVLVNVPLTRQDIAEMAGTTVESAIRAMSRWQKQGVVRTDRKIITILDLQTLSKHL